MTFHLKELKLNSSYEFDVLINDSGTCFAGKLNLSPQKVTFTIKGEQNPDRICSIKWKDLDNIICKDMNKTFILSGLKVRSGGWKNLTSTPSRIQYFETTFDVKHVIFSPEAHCQDNNFSSIQIHSETICKWVGNTETQENIIAEYHNGERDFFFKPDKLNEFVVELKDLGKLGIKYNTTIQHSSPDFRAGIDFPPSMVLNFENLQSSESIKTKYDKIYNFLGLVTGDELVVEKIQIEYLIKGFKKKASLYYPSKNIPERNKDSGILFPLGKNLRFKHTSLPSMPMEIFENYFLLDSLERGYWGKYQKYRRMKNVEERFLGYFRILEALCLKKKNYIDPDRLAYYANILKPFMIYLFDDKKSVTSFLKGLPRYNSSKYNTEKCIQDFFILIPKEVTSKWKFQKKDIGGFCKLRNDITHANDYDVTENKLLAKSKFIEVLLILALLKKVGVDLNISTKVISGLNNYFIITKDISPLGI